MRSLPLITCLLLPVTGQAQDLSLIISSFSYHVQERSYVGQVSYNKKGYKKPITQLTDIEYNEVNTGLGIEYGGNIKLVAGFYKDSFNTTAKYLGAGFTKQFKYLNYGVILGGIKSPSYGDGSVYPLVAPYISLSNKHHGVNCVILPSKVTVVALQYKLKFAY